MIIEYGKTPEEVMLALLSEQNGITMTGADVEFDYVTTTIGVHPPNSTITLRAKPGGKFANLKTITFNRIDIGEGLFQGITLKYNIPTDGSKTRWELFSEAVEKYHLPVKKTDILLPDTVFTNADLEVTVDMNPLTSMLLVGSITLVNNLDVNTYLPTMFPITEVSLFEGRQMAREDFLYDYQAAQHILNALATINGYEGTVDVDWLIGNHDIPQPTEGAYNTNVLVEARPGNAGGITGSIVVSYNRVFLTEQFANWSLGITESPENTDRYSRFQEIMRDNNMPEVYVPEAIVGGDEDTSGVEDLAIEINPAYSWLYLGDITFMVQHQLSRLWPNQNIDELTLSDYVPGDKVAIELLTYPQLVGELDDTRPIVDRMIAAIGTTPVTNVPFDEAHWDLYGAIYNTTYLLKEITGVMWTYTAENDGITAKPAPYNLLNATLVYLGPTDEALGHRTDRDYVMVVKMHPVGNSQYTGQAVLYFNKKRDIGRVSRDWYLPNTSPITAFKNSIENLDKDQTTGPITGYVNGLYVDGVQMPQPQQMRFTQLGNPLANLFNALFPGSTPLWNGYFLTTPSNVMGNGKENANNIIWGEIVYYGVPDPLLGHKTGTNRTLQFKLHPQWCSNWQGVAEFYWDQA